MRNRALTFPYYASSKSDLNFPTRSSLDATPQQAEQVARVLTAYRTRQAVLTKWRRKEGIYAHPHLLRGSRGGGNRSHEILDPTQLEMALSR